MSVKYLGWGPCTDSLLPMRAKFGVLRSHDKFRLDQFIMSPSSGKKIAVVWTLAFCDVANWRHMEKVEHGCTTTNLPLSKFQQSENRFPTPAPSWRNRTPKFHPWEARPSQAWSHEGEIRGLPNLAW